MPTQAPVRADVLARWLLRSFEPMAKGERSANLKTDREKTAELLIDAIERHWKPKTELQLAAEVSCSPGTITNAKKDGFTIGSKAVSRMFDAMGLDFRAACFDFILSPKTQPRESTKQEGTLEKLAASLAGTDQEQSAIEYLRFIASKAKR